MLLDTILREWRTEADLAMVFHQRAECLLDMGDTEEALASFKEVFEAQRSRPGVLTSAHLDFAWWVAVGGRIDLFDDAFAVLDEFEYGLIFPAVVYATYGAKALMYSARGDSQKASECARWAIEATEQKRSVLRYHPTTGIVRIKDGDVHRRLQLLATG
ncbi:MAG: hypothetical protein HZB26_23835 [Candidatus Hydrogenedentes bacterium]|nr:hypothetical protein [Candidatus Hydrogenedentota bacterium]